MPGLLDPDSATAKIMLLGDQGEGKTGAKAALVAAGYKLRTIDTDKGIKILRALLTDEEHYPYAKYMKKHGIVPDVSYIPIDVPMDFQDIQTRNQRGAITTWSVLGPASSKAWTEIFRVLKNGWIDAGKDFGKVTDWGGDTILDFDTVSTLAEMAKYWVQDMNGHLGALADDHGRDTGGAQELIMRLMTHLTNSSIKCNVICNFHIRRIDMSNDVPQSVEQRLREKKAIEPKGFPAVIGQAVGPYIGKKFNDVFVVKRDGERSTSERKIWTVAVDNTNAKNSVWLENSYSLATGLAEIFARLQYKTLPDDFIKTLTPVSNSTSEPSKPATGFGTGAFGRG